MQMLVVLGFLVSSTVGHVQYFCLPLKLFERVKNNKLIIIGFWWIMIGSQSENGLDLEPRPLQ